MKTYSLILLLEKLSGKQIIFEDEDPFQPRRLDNRADSVIKRAQKFIGTPNPEVVECIKKVVSLQTDTPHWRGNKDKEFKKYIKTLNSDLKRLGLSYRDGQMLDFTNLAKAYFIALGLQEQTGYYDFQELNESDDPFQPRRMDRNEQRMTQFKADVEERAKDVRQFYVDRIGSDGEPYPEHIPGLSDRQKAINSLVTMKGSLGEVLASIRRKKQWGRTDMWTSEGLYALIVSREALRKVWKEVTTKWDIKSVEIRRQTSPDQEKTSGLKLTDLQPGTPEHCKLYCDKTYRKGWGPQDLKILKEYIKKFKLSKEVYQQLKTHFKSKN